MKQYLKLLQHVRTHGARQEDRTGTGTLSIFGYQMRFALNAGFPLVTTRKIHLRSLIYELLWFLQGDTNIKYLNEHGVRIWDDWANEAGELGPVYGKQWISWETSDGRKINQIKELVDNLRNNPHSRRHVISAWNVGELDAMRLPPCHALFQFYVAEGRLSCQLYQRSADLFIGVPYNIASYALLTHIVAQQCDLQLGDFVWTGGDCHIYLNHLQQLDLQLSRSPLPLPQLRLLRRPPDIFSYRYDDFLLENYQHHKHIAAPVAV